MYIRVADRDDRYEYDEVHEAVISSEPASLAAMTKGLATTSIKGLAPSSSHP